MTTTETPTTEPTATAPRWRRTLVAVLVVLSCILAPLSVVAVWTQNQMLDTTRYVENVTPLASNPAILDAAATNATNALFENVDVEAEIRDALPKRARLLAAPMTAAIRQFTERAAREALASDAFQTVWVKANDVAHTQVESALTGGGKVVSTKNGKITLDLSQILVRVRDLLDERGITLFDSVPTNELALRFQLFDASGLETAQQAVKVLDALAFAFPVLFVGFLGIAIWLSPHRRRTIIRWGIGITIASGITALIALLGRGIYLDSVAGPSLPRDALAATWDTLLRFLRGGLRAMMALGLLVAFVAWILGPTKLAEKLRTTARDTVGGMGDTAEAHGYDFGRFGGFVNRNERRLQIAGVVVALLSVLFADRISASRLIWALILLVVFLGAVQFVSRAAKVATTTGAPDRGGPATG